MIIYFLVPLGHMKVRNFQLMGPNLTLVSGWNTFSVAMCIVIAPLCLFGFGMFAYMDISKALGRILVIISIALLLSGLLGFLTKLIADAYSIGLNLNSRARGDPSYKIETMTLHDTVHVGINIIILVSTLVILSSVLFFIGTAFGEIQAETYECSNGELIPIGSVEDGKYDCFFGGTYGSGSPPATGEDEVLGSYEMNSTPLIAKLIGNFLIILSGLIMLAGLIGLSTKMLADSISIGFTLFENASEIIDIHDEES